MNRMAPKVGDVMLATRPHGRDDETDRVRVSRVGRLYVTTLPEDRIPGPNGRWYERRFALRDGQESLRGGYMGGALYTEQEWEDRTEAQHLRQVLNRTHDTRVTGRASLAQLRAILAILEGPR